MPAALRVAFATLHYFGTVFLAGFLLGALREIKLVGLLGEALARLIELPIMVLISWLVARWAVRIWRVPACPRARIGMGVAAFALLMAAEFTLGVQGFGMSMGGMLASFLTPLGALGLSAQALVAIWPSLVANKRTEPS